MHGRIDVLANSAPSLSLSATPTAGTAPLTVTFTPTASDANNDPLSYAWDFGDGTTDSTPGTATHQYAAGGIYTTTMTVEDGCGGSASDQVVIIVGGTNGNIPPMVTLAASPISGTAPLTVTVTPLPGVTISVQGHPAYGQTVSRADGMFDMVVNGGGILTINYTREGYLPAHRQIEVPWRDYVGLDDVVLVPLDRQATTIMAMTIASASPR